MNWHRVWASPTHTGLPLDRHPIDRVYPQRFQRHCHGSGGAFRRGRSCWRRQVGPSCINGERSQLVEARRLRPGAQTTSVTVTSTASPALDALANRKEVLVMNNGTGDYLIRFQLRDQRNGHYPRAASIRRRRPIPRVALGTSAAHLRQSVASGPWKPSSWRSLVPSYLTPGPVTGHRGRVPRRTTVISSDYSSYVSGAFQHALGAACGGESASHPELTASPLVTETVLVLPNWTLGFSADSKYHPGRWRRGDSALVHRYNTSRAPTAG